MTSGRCIAVLTALIAVSTACSTAVTTGDAFDLGQEENRICVPAPEDPDTATMFGDTLLRASGDEAATIENVSLVGAEDMELVDAFLVAIEEGESLVGMRHTSNPAEFPAGWDTRLAAEGAEVEPGEEWNLVLVVDAQSDDIAYADAARIRYEDSTGARFNQETLTSMLVSHRPCDEALGQELG